MNKTRKKPSKTTGKSYDFSGAKRGAVLPHAGKTRITMWIDSDVLNAFREEAERECRGYQTAMNDALRSAAFQKTTHGDNAIETRIQERVRAVVHEELAHLIAS
jgi:uncharacterized protein (DUF4415 family)